MIKTCTYKQAHKLCYICSQIWVCRLPEVDARGHVDVHPRGANVNIIHFPDINTADNIITSEAHHNGHLNLRAADAAPPPKPGSTVTEASPSSPLFKFLTASQLKRGSRITTKACGHAGRPPGWNDLVHATAVNHPLLAERVSGHHCALAAVGSRMC